MNKKTRTRTPGSGATTINGLLRHSATGLRHGLAWSARALLAAAILCTGAAFADTTDDEAAAAAAAEDALFADPLDLFFEEFSEKREHIETISARFEETTILPDEVFLSTGHLFYQKPRRLIRRGEEPPTVLLVDGQSVYEYEPELRQVARYRIEDGPQAEILFFGFDENLDNLRLTYDVRLFSVADEDEPEDAKGLLITPKPVYEADAFFREVALYLREEDYLPYRIRIVSDENSHVLLDLLDLKVNTDLDEGQTTIAIPEGHTYVDENERAAIVGPEGMTLPLPALPGREEPVVEPPTEVPPLTTVEELPAPENPAP